MRKFRTVFLILIMLSMMEASAQRIYIKDQLSISGACLGYDRLRFPDNHHNIIQSKYSTSFDIGATFRHFFSNGYGLGLTIGYTMPPVKVQLNMDSPSPQFESISLKKSYCKQSLLSLAISDLAVMEVGKEGRYYLTAEGGIRVFFDISKPWSIKESSTISLNDSTNLQLYDINLNSNKTVLLGVFAKLGFLQAMTNGNTIQCAALINYNVRNESVGYYSYNNNRDYGSGTLKHPLSFIGLELTYGFTLSTRSE